MALVQTSAPAEEPVTLIEAKDHLRVSDNNSDALISELIVAARQWIENFTFQALVTQGWDLTLDAFPDAFRIPKAPLQSVSGITYLDEAGLSQTLATSVYRVDARSMPGRITREFGQTWPATRAVTGAVTISFTAGYGGATAVPRAVKQALLMMVGHWFENREASIVGVSIATLPMAVNDLLFPYAMVRFG